MNFYNYGQNFLNNQNSSRRKTKGEQL